MKNIKVIGVLLLTILLAFVSCKKVKDTYSILIKNPFSFAIEISGGGHDLFVNESEDYRVLQAGQSRTYTGTVFDSGNHLTTLNSYRQGSENANGSVTLLESESAYFYPESGENYAWNAGESEVHQISSGGDGGDGGGNSGGDGQAVFFTQANIDECSSVEVTVFRSLEEYFGTATIPPGGGIMGVKTFTGVIHSQEVTCGSTQATTFSLPPGRYYVEHVTKNCKNFGSRKYTWFEFTVKKGECTKVWLSR